jgi:hypothetical protein
MTLSKEMSMKLIALTSMGLGLTIPEALFAMTSSDKTLTFSSFNNELYHGNGNGYYYVGSLKTVLRIEV